ncbi:DUF4259 domain-containing protein [Streptomyces sp. C10-9-1]|uniref:DUF4259 domain-containing protein n=1 Tax=Streptomyces sp. C10-9-1 TaxID=1859285 RepID=UPI002111878F|nr:DUF4259 domain-containing protein [Streptomyces sp. C10-9-1]MCQ6552987.1 DUF4259 domain-containing protein [Streptomyces sp. C10-9-1]
MGTWDIGHFDNDTAADFSIRLDGAAGEERAGVLSEVLRSTADSGEYLEGDNAARAVAAAALVAAQCPGGVPVTTAYGPDEPLPPLPRELRPLAVRALDRLVGGDSELAALWDEGGEGEEWREGIARLRAVLVAARG